MGVVECPKCGANNSAKSSFCSSCGRDLSAALRCRKCGKELQKGDRFCTSCGVKNEVRKKSAKASGQYRNTGKSRSRTTAAGRGKGSRGISTTTVVVISVIVAAAAALGGFAIASATSRRPSRLASGNSGFSSLNSGAGANIKWSDDVQRIASNFNCPCGSCGITRLDHCTCDASRGAVEIKTYIKKLLDQQLSVEQVMASVEEKYGHRL